MIIVETFERSGAPRATHLSMRGQDSDAMTTVATSLNAPYARRNSRFRHRITVAPVFAKIDAMPPMLLTYTVHAAAATNFSMMDGSPPSTAPARHSPPMPLPHQIPIERRPPARLPAGGFRTPAPSPAGRSRLAGIRKPFTIADLDRAVMGGHARLLASFFRKVPFDEYRKAASLRTCLPPRREHRSDVGSWQETRDQFDRFSKIVPPVPRLSVMEGTGHGSARSPTPHNGSIPVGAEHN